MVKRFGGSILSALLLGSVPACSTGVNAPAPAKLGPSSSAQPSWATADNYIGRVPASDEISVQVHLRLRNEAQADVELAAITTPDNPLYGHFLTDEQFEAMHAPSVADVVAVRKHLEANGLSVDFVPGNRAFISARGSAAQIETVFKTKLSLYNVKGETRRAASSLVKMPDALSDKVLGVAGLTESRAYPHASSGERAGIIKRSSLVGKVARPNDVPANTCSEWFGKVPDTLDPAIDGYPPLAYVPCGYRPGVVRDTYGLGDLVRKGNDGTGQAVAVVGAYSSPTLVADAQTYAFNNDPDYPLADGQLTSLVGPGTVSPPDTGWYGEQTLDVEAVHATAPGAKIFAVGAVTPYDQDLIAAINMVIDKKLATIISNSYGMTEAGANNYVLWNHILKIAALKGIGVYFSSGDAGDNSFGFFSSGPVADFPASSDLVTAVGGTSLALGPAGNIVFETGWETGALFLQATTTADGGVGPSTWDPPAPGFFAYGSGGGTSLVYDQPAWQKGIVPDALANLPGVPARVIPDVAMVGDPITGFLIGQTDPNLGTYGEYAIGGTSLSCPLFAGTMALAQQHAKRVFGFANPLLYRASTKGAFRDIGPLPAVAGAAIPGGVAVTFDFPGLTIHTTAGFDNVTGLGVPNGKKFIDAVK